ncbi:MAG: hypothetical protein VX278_11475 [Myxococcota bacterium]|nr:hypothetical protein [Myxococcota bacterium]
MPFRYLKKEQNAIGVRVYPLLQEAYDVIHHHPALAGLRIRQALEEVGRYRMWTKHGYPLREDDEPYEIHRLAHSIYQRISSLLHIETIDPFDEVMVRRTARLQLRRIHELVKALYPAKGVRYVPPRSQNRTQEESDFEDIQEQIDNFDVLIGGEDGFFVQLSDAAYDRKEAELYELIRKNQTLLSWQRDLLLFQLDLVDVNRDIQKKQFDDVLSPEIEKRIQRLLQSGQPQALPSVYEFYRRRQASAIHDFHFEKAYVESQALLEQLSLSPKRIGDIDLSFIRNPLKGRVLSTFGRITAIYAHTYEDLTELERAYQLFEQAEAELVDPEERAQQRLLMIHVLLEKERIDPEEPISKELDERIAEVDKCIQLYLDDKLGESVFRIDLRIAVRLKVALCRKERYAQLSALSAKIASEIDSTDIGLHHPWDHIAGLLYILQPNNTPRPIKKMLKAFAAIDPSAEESLLGMIARCYMLEAEYQKGKAISTAQQTAFVASLPPDARRWWEEYDIGTRFRERCQQMSKGSPLDILPFDMS